MKITPSKKNIGLYFIALLPTADCWAMATAMKKHIATKYDSKAALKSPPHITLHMPFKLKEPKEDKLVRLLKGLALSCPKFDVQFNGFGSFAPRVIFLDVINTDVLQSFKENLEKAMKKEMNIFNADYKSRVFQPHLTLAFRDLKKAAFAPAWEEFKDKAFQHSFEASQLTLLKHNGKHWDVFRQFNFAQV